MRKHPALENDTAGPRTLAFLARLQRSVENALATIAGVVVCLMAIAVTVDSGGRYLFSAPIVGMTELVSLYGMVIVVWFGAPLAQRTGANIRVDILADRLPPKFMAVADRINAAIAGAAIGYIAYSMLKHGMANWGRAQVGGFDLPTGPPYFILALGSCLVMVRILVGGTESVYGAIEDSDATTVPSITGI